MKDFNEESKRILNVDALIYTVLLSAIGTPLLTVYTPKWGLPGAIILSICIVVTLVYRTKQIVESKANKQIQDLKDEISELQGNILQMKNSFSSRLAREYRIFHTLSHILRDSVSELISKNIDLRKEPVIHNSSPIPKFSYPTAIHRYEDAALTESFNLFADSKATSNMFTQYSEKRIARENETFHAINWKGNYNLNRRDNKKSVLHEDIVEMVVNNYNKKHSCAMIYEGELPGFEGYKSHLFGAVVLKHTNKEGEHQNEINWIVSFHAMEEGTFDPNHDINKLKSVVDDISLGYLVALAHESSNSKFINPDDGQPVS